MMKKLEVFLKPTQPQLFKMLCGMYDDKIVECGKFILVKGEVPVMLIAHLDTVHQSPVQDLCRSANGNVLMSPQGIGGDDRCGVYAITGAYELSVKKPWLLYTCDEETGGIGADFFCSVYRAGKLPAELDRLKMLIEIDRRGSNDAVYYDCDNKDFEKYITGKGFKTSHGSFSDISYIAPEPGVAAVNLSSGYYNAHTTSEYIVRSEINNTMKKVIGMVSDAAKADFPKYEYVPATKLRNYEIDWYHNFWSQTDDDVPAIKKLSKENEDMYYELLDYGGYEVDELEYCREQYGDGIIADLYKELYEDFEMTEASKVGV